VVRLQLPVNPLAMKPRLSLPPQPQAGLLVVALIQSKIRSPALCHQREERERERERETGLQMRTIEVWPGT
jgi:hypothetical protein